MKPSGRKALMYTVMFLLMGVFVEIMSTILVYQKYHGYFAESLQYNGRSATGFLVRKLLESKNGKPAERETTSKPEPFRIPDSLHGYRIANGHFEVTYRKRHFDSMQLFKHYVTINPDGDRYVGEPDSPTERDVYVFGDSFIFGEGVNDEQTFTYLLQSRFRNTRFHLYANPGHSLSNAYLNFQRLAKKIGKEDIVILGYAQFYDVRHVAAPERMVWWGESHAHKSLDPKAFKHVRARLNSDSLIFDKIPLFCSLMGDYCSQPGPSQGYMDTVTARLVNGIAEKTEAKVFLLHFHGDLRKGMTSQLDPRVRYIHAEPESFDYDYRDDINGFNPHPGPFWNHAMFRRMTDTLRTMGLK
jgi:hypothetical protein